MKSWKQKAALAALALTLSAPSSALAASDFLSIVEDVPLVKGLVEDLDQSMAFDKPGGRIAEALACGEGDGAQFMKAYAATLPRLGWEKVGKAWVRDGDRLSLTLEGAIDLSCIRFRVTPR